ncbi:MAG TPA: hypothetical protein VFZ30_10675 [Acidimicrobiales bacterium]
MASKSLRYRRRGVELVAAAGVRAARLPGQLVRLAVGFVRTLRLWPAVAVVWWLLRRAGVSTPTATALVLGPCLVTGVVAWWVLAVEPRLFAPRPSTRPRVIAGPAPRRAPAAEVDGLDHVAFARALAVVAVRYLDECQANAGRNDRGDW